MHPHHFFASLCQDLEDSTHDGSSDYKLIRAAGILRLLFLDSHPLVHKINRELRVPLKFKVSPHEAGDIAAKNPSLHFDGEPPLWDIAAVSPFGQPSEEVALDKFLRRVAITLSGHSYSVRNVIKCVAHVSGGIHYLPPEDEREQYLYEMSKSLEIYDRELLLHTIIDISRVALDGLTPLLHSASASP